MRLSIVCIEGDHRAQCGALLMALHRESTGRVKRDQRGLEVWAALEQLTKTASEPLDYLQLGFASGFTVLADENGWLAECGGELRRLARSWKCQLLQIWTDPPDEIYGFSHQSSSGLVRIHARAGQDVETLGSPLVAEKWLGSDLRNDGYFISLAQSVGLDLAGLNANGRFDVLELRLPKVENIGDEWDFGVKKGPQRSASIFGSMR